MAINLAPLCKILRIETKKAKHAAPRLSLNWVVISSNLMVVAMIAAGAVCCRFVRPIDMSDCLRPVRIVLFVS